MAKTLLLLRHAKSSWDDPSDDHERPLNKRGKREAPRMGELLRDEDLVPDLILCSTAKRARRTAEKVAEACEFRGETRLLGDLYMASPEAIRRALATAGDARRVLAIGHNPGFEELLEQLIGRYEPMTTAALAALELSTATWSELDESTVGSLRNLWQPRELA